MGRKLTAEEKRLIRKYGHLFENSGGNDVIQFMERMDINPFNNILAFTMQSCLFAQLTLIQRLINEDLIY